VRKRFTLVGKPTAIHWKAHSSIKVYSTVQVCWFISFPITVKTYISLFNIDVTWRPYAHKVTTRQVCECLQGKRTLSVEMNKDSIIK